MPDSSRKTGAFILPARAYFGDLVNFDRRSATLCEKSPHTLDFMDSSSGDVRHNGDGRIPICGSMGSHPLGFVWLNNLCAGVHLYLAVVGHSGAAKNYPGGSLLCDGASLCEKSKFLRSGCFEPSQLLCGSFAIFGLFLAICGIRSQWG